MWAVEDWFLLVSVGVQLLVVFTLARLRLFEITPWAIALFSLNALDNLVGLVARQVPLDSRISPSLDIATHLPLLGISLHALNVPKRWRAPLYVACVASILAALGGMAFEVLRSETALLAYLWLFGAWTLLGIALCERIRQPFSRERDAWLLLIGGFGIGSNAIQFLATIASGAFLRGSVISFLNAIAGAIPAVPLVAALVLHARGYRIARRRVADAVSLGVISLGFLAGILRVRSGMIGGAAPIPVIYMGYLISSGLYLGATAIWNHETSFRGRVWRPVAVSILAWCAGLLVGVPTAVFWLGSEWGVVAGVVTAAVAALLVNVAWRPPRRVVLEGGYRVVKPLGSGSEKVVELAVDGLDRYVVVKRPLGLSAESQARFIQEAKTLASIKHPHVVTIHDAHETTGGLRLIEEFLEGGSLADRLQLGKPDLRFVMQVGYDALAGLGAVHEAGFVHRDVKPGNILLTAEGRAKIGDFGIARPSEVVATVTPGGIGTLAYMSREAKEGKATSSSDLYSMGVVLWGCLGGEVPVPVDRPPLPAPDVSPAWQPFFEKALAPFEEDRFESAREMSDALRLVEQQILSAHAQPSMESLAMAR